MRMHFWKEILYEDRYEKKTSWNQSCSYYGCAMRCCIQIGFLDDSASVDIGNVHIDLSTFIVVPSFKIMSQEKKGQYFNVTHSLSRTHGIIEIHDNVDIKTALDACDAMFSKEDLDYGYFPLHG